MPLRYAVLHHTGVPAPHFDLLVETYPGSNLTTWRASHWPITGPTPLTRLKDHRRIYLEFEGDLTQRRGRVDRVAGGMCEVEVAEGGRWTVRLLSGGPRESIQIRPIAGDGCEARPAE